MILKIMIRVIQNWPEMLANKIKYWNFLTGWEGVSTINSAPGEGESTDSIIISFAEAPPLRNMTENH